MAISIGDVVLASLRDEDGDAKLRPALVVALLPGEFQTVLVCGITTRTDRTVPDWDEWLDPEDGDFLQSGLHARSSLRLSFLVAIPERIVRGRIGEVANGRLERVRGRLAALIVGSN